MKHVGIIGGGIIGLSAAYYLSKAGHRVTILDQGDMTDGCSYGNAGMIVPSHFIPMAAPGMISKGIRWMFNSQSPFYVQPRLSGSLIKWGYHFYKSSTAEHVERSIPVLKEISLLSKANYQSLAAELPAELGFQQAGLVMLYQTAETEHEERETAHLAKKNGIDAIVLSSREVQQLEPDVEVKARGGVFYAGDAHITPYRLMPVLKALLSTRGVKFETGTRVTDFVVDNEKRVKVTKTSDHDLTEFAFDEIVIACGSWSPLLTAKLAISLPLQPGKGYSFDEKNTGKQLRVPSILVERRVAVTPMGTHTRFGGTLEISGLDNRINMNRVKGIVDAIPEYFPSMSVPMPTVNRVWHGFRPCSPDGLPYIGRVRSVKNVVIATGHSMMGLSLGPATGQLVEEIISENKLSMDISMFDPQRF